MAEKLFAKFDLDFADNPKIIGLSCEAFRAFVESVLYSRQHLTDGFIDQRVVVRKWGTAVAEELSTNDSKNPSWSPVENGWQIHGFEDKQTTKAEIAEKREKRREAGIKSGAARRELSKQRTNTEQSVQQNVNKTEPETETETETINTLHQSAIEERFEAFWNVYPRKVGKVSARKAFLKAASVANPLVIIGGADRMASDPNLPEAAFIPHAATWLNRGGWDDEPYPKKPEPTMFAKTYVAPAPGMLSSDASLYCKEHGYLVNDCPRCEDGETE